MDLHRRQKSFFIWAVVLFTVFLVWSVSITPSGQQPANLSYSKALALLADASERQIPVEITIRRDKWTITLKDQVYKTTAPLSEEVLKKLSEDKNIELIFLEERGSSIWVTLLVSWLPMVVIFIILIYVFRYIVNKSGSSSGICIVNPRACP